MCHFWEGHLLHTKESTSRQTIIYHDLVDSTHSSPFLRCAWGQINWLFIEISFAGFIKRKFLVKVKFTTRLKKKVSEKERKMHIIRAKSKRNRCYNMSCNSNIYRMSTKIFERKRPICLRMTFAIEDNLQFLRKF